MNRLLLAAAAALAFGLAGAQAQTAAELLVVAQLSAVLDPAVSLPRGTYQVTNGSYATALAAQVGFDAQPGSLVLYQATGIIGKLADEFAGNLAASFAAQGYLPAADATRTVNGLNTRWEDFQSDEGKTIRLVIVKDANRVRLLVGLAR
ncbi:MAG TPA: hypothetical protein VHN99_07000 [Deinococcales bacterium]|nr:hypothetical protein [Deinococcales bacterium]